MRTCVVSKFVAIRCKCMMHIVLTKCPPHVFEVYMAWDGKHSAVGKNRPV